LKEGGWDGEVFEKSLAKRHLRLFLYPEEADLAPSRAAGVARDAKNESYAPPEAVWMYNHLVQKAKTEIPVKT
jgi:hypothetical protein